MQAHIHIHILFAPTRWAGNGMQHILPFRLNYDNNFYYDYFIRIIARQSYV